jgi:hypothetical protein
MVMQSVTKLQQTELVEYTGEGNGGLASTEYGDIMSKVCLRIPLCTYRFDPILVLYSTINRACAYRTSTIFLPLITFQMGLILALPPRATLREIVRSATFAGMISSQCSFICSWK